MCNALRVSKEEMRNFVQGKKSEAAAATITTAAECSSNRDVGGGISGPLQSHGRNYNSRNQQALNDDSGPGDDDDDDGNGNNNDVGRTLQQKRFPQHHPATMMMQNNNQNHVTPLHQQADTASSSTNHRHHQRHHHDGRPLAVVNPYAKQSRPSSSYNENNDAMESNVTGQRSTQIGNHGLHSTINAAPFLQGNDLGNQPIRPLTATNPYYSNTSRTTMNVSTSNNNNHSTNRFAYSDENSRQGHSHLPPPPPQQQQQQHQRLPVSNPYKKSITKSPSTVSHSNAPHSFAVAAPNQQPHTTETRQHTANLCSNNATTINSNVNNNQQNQNLHRFFTGAAARPTATSGPPSQRPTKSGVGNNNHSAPPAATVASSLSSSNNNRQQRFSLSAKKQLPYIQGPIPLCTATSSNWIYPIDDKYPERTYQLEMSESAILYNTLVSLPTGLGKTLIAAVVMYNYYRWFPEGKVVFCAPTRPLVTQQIHACYKIMGIPERYTAEISGRVPNTSRKQMWDNKRVFFCTPQTLVKDIEEDRCDASKIVCVVMDEAHRATGMHTFALLPNMIEAAGAKFRLVALSATPGTDIKSIQAVVETLKISKIEARTEDDPNVKRYVHNREEEVISVKQPDVIKILDKKLLEFVRDPLEKLRSVNAASRLMGDSANLSPFAVMKAREEYEQRTGDRRLYHTFEALRNLVDIRINLKNHGIQYALQNIARKEIEAKGPLRSILYSDEFKALKCEMQVAAGDPTECLSKNNPKYEKLTDVLLEHFERKQAIGESTRAIVFSQLRESVMGIVSMLSSKNAALLKPTPFVGQSKKKESESNPGQEVAGMNQAEQQRILQQFNEGRFNVLVCTCVGEEGLDIGDVDLIVNFDILKSAIRSIQRTGRTGRKRNGRVIFLVSEGQEERSYRDSVTNSRKIARALKDPSVFKLCQNSPMFPDEPSLLRQKMVVDDFHMSQVGGHTPKTRGRGKTGRSSKRSGDKIAAVDDSWRLVQAQQKERMNLFGNLPYSSHSVYESETIQGDFPASLRKKYLKARRRSQQSKHTGRGRSSTLLASLEKLYMCPTGRRESISMMKKPSFDDDDDDDEKIDDSVEGANPSVAFDVESDCDLLMISEKGDDDDQIGCHEVSPEHNNNSLEAIFGTISVKHSGCLNSQQIANLFDSAEHKHCSVRAPPPFGGLQCDECSGSCDESSSLSSESSEQSQLSANTMDDDALCAFFDNSHLPARPQQNSAVERENGSTIGEVVCDEDKDVDDGVGGELDFNDGADFHVSSDDDVEPQEEKESICNSQSDPRASLDDDVELNSSVAKEIAQDEEIAQDAYQNMITHNGVENSCQSNDESLIDAENCGGDNIEHEGDSVDERSDPEVLSPILSPIPTLSPVAAFRLPTPPPSSSDDDDDEEESDDQSGAERETIGENNVSSGVNGQLDLATSKPSPDHRSSMPLEIIGERNFSCDFEHNQCVGGNDVQEEDISNDKIDPLQLPTQYSSSDDDDDDDESEGQSECEDDVDMKMFASNDATLATNVGNKEVVTCKYAIGTKISKEFKDPKSGQMRLYQGQIAAFYSQDNQDKLYNVVFEDGDCEDMEESEIEVHLARNEDLSLENDLGSQTYQPCNEFYSRPLSKMSPDDLTDTPVLKHMPKQKSRLRLSMDSLTDTPVAQRAPERKSRMSLDGLSLTDTPVQHMPERKRLRLNNNQIPKDTSKDAEKMSRQDRLKQRIEEKYRCRFLDTEAANDDSDSGDEEEEDDDEMSHDSFINDTSQLGYSQDDLDRLNESVEECDHEESDTLHRQLNHQQSVRNQFKTPIFNRRMQLSRSQESQTSIPPSQRGLGNMNFIRSVIDHCRQGGDCEDIETEYHRLVGESSQDMSMSQIDDDAKLHSHTDVPKAEERQPQRHPPTVLALNNINDSIRVGLGSQQTRKIVATANNASKERATVAAKSTELTAEQKAMIEAKRQAALRLRQQKQMMNQHQTTTRQQQQVRINPYAK